MINDSPTYFSAYGQALQNQAVILWEEWGPKQVQWNWKDFFFWSLWEFLTTYTKFFQRWLPYL